MNDESASDADTSQKDDKDSDDEGSDQDTSDDSDSGSGSSKSSVDLKNYFTKEEVSSLVEDSNATLQTDLRKIKEEILKQVN